MNIEHLKQAEVFVFLAAVFLISASFLEMQRKENPPIIILSEQNQQYRFSLGSAKIPHQFKEQLVTRIIPLLDSLSQIYHCDAIEVVGHTDGVPIRNTNSNLDRFLVPAFNHGQVEALNPGSNVDLGMMRSLAIIQILQDSKKKGWLKHIRYFFPYSAGQMIQLDKSLTSRNLIKNNKARRRIEIRLLNSTTHDIQSFF